MAATDQNRLEQGLTALGVEYSVQQVERLLAFQDLLRKWNHHFNLVGAGELDRFVTRHLLDSLAIVHELDGAQTILDVGSGAGLPGIPLAILLPGKHFLLLDSNSKKTRFLFQARLALGLVNVDVENCRIEHYQSPRQIDIVTCRAFSSLADTLNKARHCFHPETVLLALKGRHPGEEIAQLPSDFRVVASRPLRIPEIDSARHLIAVKMRGAGG